MSTDLRVDPARVGEYGVSGIYVRALQPDGAWDSVDILSLGRESLLTWLRSRDTSSEPDPGKAWRENIILIVLGHRP